MIDGRLPWRVVPAKPPMRCTSHFAAVHGMDFLLAWNCTHIANGVILKIVNAVCRDRGYEPPIVCTPEELLAA